MPTFLHAADLHLDSPLRGLDRREGASAQRIREASRIALMRMVDNAIERKVSFALLAGDIYDSQPAFETYLFFHQQVERLASRGIPVAIVLGNHDHGGVSPRAERLPSGVHVFPADRPSSLEIVPNVWVHGQSYPTRDIAHDLTVHYPPPVPGMLNIGLLHTALDGHSGEHARYAPSTTQSLTNHGYAYWALGHVHAPLVLEEYCCHIVYPGNLQGRHVREIGPKGAMFVNYSGNAISGVQHAAFDDVRWYRVEIDVAQLDHGHDLLRQVCEHVLAATHDCRRVGRLAAVRVCLHGVAPVALVDLGEDEISESLRAMLGSESGLFLEKIKLDLRVPAQAMHEVDQHLTTLISQVGAEREADSVFAAARADVLKGLRDAGGPDLVEAFQALRLAEGGWPKTEEQMVSELSTVLPRVRKSLLSRGKGGR